MWIYIALKYSKHSSYFFQNQEFQLHTLPYAHALIVSFTPLFILYIIWTISTLFIYNEHQIFLKKLKTALIILEKSVSCFHILLCNSRQTSLDTNAIMKYLRTSTRFACWVIIDIHLQLLTETYIWFTIKCNC